MGRAYKDRARDLRERALVLASARCEEAHEKLEEAQAAVRSAELEYSVARERLRQTGALVRHAEMAVLEIEARLGEDATS